MIKNLSFNSTAKYTFIGEIGRGGMGLVFLAQRECEGVADLLVLKTIKTLSSDKLDALRNEARLAATLRHENIVRTYGLESIPLSRLPKAFINEITNMKAKSSETNRELGKEALEKIKDGYTYKGKQTIKPAEKSEEKLYLMVMDYIEGNDLREFMMKHFKRGILFPLPISAFIISRICRALEYAHAIIIHRDLSPENILINKQGVAKLTDFGIAVAISQEGTDFAGKLQYMSPEQFSRQKIDARSDIFAMGLMAYQLSTGISIFQPIQNLTFEEQYKHVRELMRLDIIPPHEICTDIPKEYSNIIMKMLAFKKNDRYQSMVEVTNDLERKYLYAKGFGPTNQSLQAYLDIVNKDFKDTDQEQLRKLSFLANESKKIQLRRKINENLYTKAGLAEAKTRGALSILSILNGLKQSKTE